MNFSTVADAEVVAKTSAALTERGFVAHVVNTKEEALAKIKELIPAGASINNGSSVTLSQIGFVDYLKEGTHGWNNLHEAALTETDPAKQAQLRQEAVHSEYYLGSVHALTESGEAVIASATGSQLAPITFTSHNLILVVGAQKIVPTMEAALTRLREHVYPLEDERMKSVGMGGSVMAKILLLEREPAFMSRTVHFIVITEALGF
jgi:hypothetical protein